MAIDETTKLTSNKQNPLTVFRRHLIKMSLLLAISFVVLMAGTVYLLNQAPNPTEKTLSLIVIEPGTNVRSISQQLESAGVVRSSDFLYLVLNLFYDTASIKASTYNFTPDMTTRDVARRLVEGEFVADLIKFTHREGERVTHVAVEASEFLEGFDKARFIELATPLEGKLYPETYHIPKSFKAEELVALLANTYEEQVFTIKSRMTEHPLGENGVLTLASIIEREANTPESMKIISGILQGRMAVDMPLQADASIEYVLDKPLKELTAEDLKVDSPYNTYTNRGLPPTPIGNPGIDAIMSVLEPTESEYVYYITDDQGNFHYSETYEEHLANVRQYLR